MEFYRSFFSCQDRERRRNQPDEGSAGLRYIMLPLRAGVGLGLGYILDEISKNSLSFSQKILYGGFLFISYFL